MINFLELIIHHFLNLVPSFESVTLMIDNAFITKESPLLAVFIQTKEDYLTPMVSFLAG